ncbi:xylulokinase [Paenibacillus physcomitrellae]|uniref:Xylulose kinase n=1 Tax=Paenibacillus physcomitrellae TaxID=1619311 RepID=A0ABQ1GB78_9BACL|nr:xylulokinase [Paenibacillus physcomitrellae]GGA40300.1 xylulose kinase [Paenibacillus physcomitrellae]
MEYVIGIDLGTSSVKALLVNREGKVCGEASESYPLITPKSGYSEQDPEEWVEKSLLALRKLAHESGIEAASVKGISFSGQMHGLVLLDDNHRVLRNAILWNDTRTTKQCREIEEKLGEQLLSVTRNPALEGFTLPKILWVQQNEPELFAKASVFLLPKDYLRYRLTGELGMDYSDAAGTLMLDVAGRRWSPEVLEAFGLDESFCPKLVASTECVGTLLPEMAVQSGLTADVKVFGGGADNACGATGAGILGPGETLCSIGTSGVILSYEENASADYEGKVHFFNHAEPDAFYAMGVTLAAGSSLSWFRDTFAPGSSFDELLAGAATVPAGADGLLFTPYLSGERTPHADSAIRGSFIGMDLRHKKEHFARAVVEGITFSLRESIEILRGAGKQVDTIVSIGGGARSELWLQMQADIFNAEVVRLESEQGPAMGAAMLAAAGLSWFSSLKECAGQFIAKAASYKPSEDQVKLYNDLYPLYKEVYDSTQALNRKLEPFRS